MGIEWQLDYADRWFAWRTDVHPHERLGQIQKFGERWYWGVTADPHWHGPVDSQAEATRALLEAIGTTEAEARPGG